MSVRYLLDTNICIYITKQRPMSVLHHFEKCSVGEVGMSVITYGELYYGVNNSSHPKKNRVVLEELVKLIPSIAMPEVTAIHYGEIRNKLKQQGALIGSNDLWIAAHSLALNTILITNNVNEFSRVPHLKIENWVD